MRFMKVHGVKDGAMSSGLVGYNRYFVNRPF